MYDYGNMSVYFWDGLKQAEQDLRTKQDYSSAVAFDAAVPGGVPLTTYDTAFVNDTQDVFSIDFSVMSDEANSEIFCYRHDKETGEAVQIAVIPMEQENYEPFIMTGANWQEVDGYLYGSVAIYDKEMLNTGGVRPLEYRVYCVNEEDGSWDIIA